MTRPRGAGPIRLVTLAMLAMQGEVAYAQTGCEGYGPLVEAGWARFRSGNIVEADSLFARAHAGCPSRPDAQVGLGYTALRSQRLDEAEARFADALRQAPEDVDGLLGLGLVAWQRGDSAGAVRGFDAVRRIEPGNAVALDFLGRLGALPPPPRPALVVPDTVEAVARTRGDRFEVLTPGGWRPFYVNGLNLGAALPGRFPSEFPDSATYVGWIAAMAEMTANTIRVYTIHPPHFYQALQAHNLAHPERALRVIHGVWAELPPEHDYRDSVWEGEFLAEMRRVVDLVHGRADIPRRPGHASGSYTADVSRWVLAYLIGREWEPFSVVDFNQLRTADTIWPGRYVSVRGGAPMDAWLARVLDSLVAYETAVYRTQRPVGYTNWPTLDPMHHPTESTAREEVAIRERQGERVAAAPREFDNDVVGLDATLLTASAEFRAGVFAAFHAYPYYPDFMLLDSAYGRAASSEGPSNYFGYLQDLKAHHPDMPVVIAEYGVPASRGIAHLQPQGWHHGGHTEAQMAAINARMTREIAEAGMAGGILFAWIDEWFKKNWLVVAFELPADRNRLWLNRLDPEQMYGVVAMEPVVPVAGGTAAERGPAWAALAPVVTSADGTLRVAADAAALWFRFDPVGPSPTELQIGLDLVDSAAGAMALAGPDAPASGIGLEAVIRVRGDTARVLTDPAVLQFRRRTVRRDFSTRELRIPAIAERPAGYFSGRFAQEFHRPIRPIERPAGDFRGALVVTNRVRFGRDGQEYAAVGYDRGVLRAGPLPDGDWERLPDGAIEIRVPWLLLNVSDPSGRRLLLDAPGARGTEPHGITTMDSVGVALGVLRGGKWTTTPGSAVGRYLWSGWEEPRWVARRRPTFEVMRETWCRLEDSLGGEAP